MRGFFAACLVVLSGLLWGCSGGFNCPFDKPACCDNAVFGCGVFDLPDGCSCNDYALRSFSGATLAGARPQSVLMSVDPTARARALSASGTWRSVGHKIVPASCPLFPTRVTRTLLIRQTGARVRVKLMGYGTLRGTRVRNSVRAQGAHKVPALGCVAFVRSQLSVERAVSSPHTVTIDWRCQERANSCSVIYRGVAKKLG
jgi:hypothetical protein